ncbi:hypothetical protein LOAG_03292 [Loa loa]|uniref:Secreted protein n=1 Tax=Loa loa TaxID=7209 RepID=A0A1I7VH03_LOALO|nr:hypothetical protein LOAG_03292 [Loa loa]EFO25193.1 hypothetical protein LOAG_03292 [Loa loa]
MVQPLGFGCELNYGGVWGQTGHCPFESRGYPKAVQFATMKNVFGGQEDELPAHPQDPILIHQKTFENTTIKKCQAIEFPIQLNATTVDKTSRI